MSLMDQEQDHVFAMADTLGNASRTMGRAGQHAGASGVSAGGGHSRPVCP